jgi:hypothetical protein
MRPSYHLPVYSATSFESQNRPIQIDIFPSHHMRMESGPERDQGADSAPDRDFAMVGRKDAGDEAQERGFAAAVAPDQP